jgi:hypothetical protein
MRFHSIGRDRSGGMLRSVVVTIAAGLLTTGVMLAASAVPAAAKATPTPILTNTPSSGAVGIGGKISDTVTVTGTNPTGKIIFTLFPPADAGQCVNLKKPIFTSTVSLVDGSATSGTYTVTGQYGYGTYTWIAYYGGDKNNASNSTTCTAGRVIVTLADPTISTMPSGTVPIGGNLSDSATLAGADHPKGTFTFEIFAVDDTSCSGGFDTSTVPVDNGTNSSGNFIANGIGTFNWIVRYSGDSNNEPVTSPCGETITTTQATPTLTTNPSKNTVVGGLVDDVATVSGGFDPTGTVTFELFSPGDTNCTGTPVIDDDEPLNPAGKVTSESETTSAVGTYRWIAIYNGDTNNVSVTSPCGGTSGDPEKVKTTQATPTISTQVSGSTATLDFFGDDTATVSGGDNPGGTVTFYFFHPGTTCSSTGSGADFVDGPISLSAGSATSDLVTFSTAGTYQWVAAYSGDANNAGVHTNCGDEPVTVSKATPTVTTSCENDECGGVSPVTGLSDTATVTPGATGTVTFSLYTNDTCTGPAVYTDTEPLVSGSSTTTDSGVVTTGNYWWVANYSGDSNYNGLANACGNEPVVIDPPIG